MTIQASIARVIDGQDLTRDEMVVVMNAIMSGEATDAQIGGFLVGLRIKGETVEEIEGAAVVMREKATRILRTTSSCVSTALLRRMPWLRPTLDRVRPVTRP